METTLLYRTPTFIIIILLFCSSLFIHWLGYKAKQKRIAENKLIDNTNSGTILGSLLGLLALLLSFTFSMASARYDNRRQILIEEANDIGTAILRADLYPDSIRKPLRADFQKYVEARIDYYDAEINNEKIKKSLQHADEIQQRLWKRVSEAAQDPKNLVRSNQMVPALNSMIDIVTTREATNNETVPESIIWFLFILLLSSSFMIGFSNEKKINYVLISGFSIMISLTIFIILDLDRPRRGIITTKNSQQKLVNLRSMFEESKK